MPPGMNKPQLIAGAVRFRSNLTRSLSNATEFKIDEQLKLAYWTLSASHSISRSGQREAAPLLLSRMPNPCPAAE